MLPGANAIAFAFAAFALIIIPGPSVLFVIGRSLALGRRGGILSVVGNALGALPAVAAVSLGLGAIVAESVVVFTIIKFAGAAYLAYLGVQAIRHRSDEPVENRVTAASRRSSGRLLWEGFLVGLTNPKTIVFFVAVLPQFVSYSSGSVGLQLFLLGLIFFAIGLASDTVWALAAGTARQWFATNSKRRSRMNAGGGIMMIAVGGTLGVTGTKG